jgi:hypothetical protein
MIASQFKPGFTPWNKGKPGSTGLHANCRATQFQRGRPPEAARNYVPLGSLRLSKDGYLERKVTDAHPVPARRWVAEHRLVWERAHGAIPPGHIIVFRPGQRTAKEADINARRNHPRNVSPDLARLVQLKGAITRQVNRISREARQAKESRA